MSDNENGCEREKTKKNHKATEAGDQNVASVNGRKGLLFPQECARCFMEKLRPAMQLARDHCNFKPLIRKAEGGRISLCGQAGQSRPS